MEIKSLLLRIGIRFIFIYENEYEKELEENNDCDNGDANKEHEDEENKIKIIVTITRTSQLERNLDEFSNRLNRVHIRQLMEMVINIFLYFLLLKLKKNIFLEIVVVLNRMVIIIWKKIEKIKKMTMQCYNYHHFLLYQL